MSNLTVTFAVALALAPATPTAANGGRTAALGRSSTLAISNVQFDAIEPVPLFGRVDLHFAVSGSVARVMLWPYDAAPPRGVRPGAGITVDAVFVDPAGRRIVQPAFYAQRFLDDTRNGRDWRLPTGEFAWHVRFSPDRTGHWTCWLVARDASGTIESPRVAFTVGPSPSRGFIRVAPADRRYFEFDDGTLFTGLGFELPELLDRPITAAGEVYRTLAGFGVNFVRLTLASIFGSAWTPWIGGRNQYRGYLPVTGLVPFTDPRTGETNLVMRLDYEPAGDTGWFDACRMESSEDLDAVQPDTTYRLRVEYFGDRIEGPRDPSHAGHGVVVTLGGRRPDCYEPARATPVTTYGHSNDAWDAVEGIWHSGRASFLPRLHVGLENVRSGAAYVRSISLREARADGTLGPELLTRSSMQVDTYVAEAQAHAFDLVLEAAERSGVYLKVVVGERNDKMYLKLADSGDWVTDRDNLEGYYGTGRAVNRTRWLQQAWWRYIQARWGYSPHVHSWELLNEGDPDSLGHYALADEFGKFMHCRVFGLEVGPGDGQRCTFDHPNGHLVTTSFWSGFPAQAFWKNPRYPNVDYADIHAYVSTSPAPRATREVMQADSALYHTWHSDAALAAAVGKPVVRGEAGLDSADAHGAAIGLDRDQSGTWLHNFLWAGLDAGGLYELYWWNSHIWSGRTDHRGEYLAVARFLADLPLNQGGYTNWDGTASDPRLSVVGQKNPQLGRMHLWIRNQAYTWRSMADRVAVAPVHGTLRVPGFAIGARYQVEWYDTHLPTAPVTSVEHVTADADGTLFIAVGPLLADVAIQVRPAPRGGAQQEGVSRASVAHHGDVQE